MNLMFSIAASKRIRCRRHLACLPWMILSVFNQTYKSCHTRVILEAATLQDQEFFTFLLLLCEWLDNIPVKGLSISQRLWNPKESFPIWCNTVQSCSCITPQRWGTPEIKQPLLFSLDTFQKRLFAKSSLNYSNKASTPNTGLQLERIQRAESKRWRFPSLTSSLKRHSHTAIVLLLRRQTHFICDSGLQPVIRPE